MLEILTASGKGPLPSTLLAGRDAEKGPTDSGGQTPNFENTMVGNLSYPNNRLYKKAWEKDVESIDVANYSSLVPQYMPDEFTIEMWIMGENQSTNFRIFYMGSFFAVSCGATANPNDVVITIRGTDYRVNNMDKSRFVTLRHVALVREAGNFVKLYIDGKNTRLISPQGQVNNLVGMAGEVVSPTTITLGSGGASRFGIAKMTEWAIHSVAKYRADFTPDFITPR